MTTKGGNKHSTIKHSSNYFYAEKITRKTFLWHGCYRRTRIRITRWPAFVQRCVSQRIVYRSVASRRMRVSTCSMKAGPRNTDPRQEGFTRSLSHFRLEDEHGMNMGHHRCWDIKYMCSAQKQFCQLLKRISTFLSKSSTATCCGP